MLFITRVPKEQKPGETKPNSRGPFEAVRQWLTDHPLAVISAFLVTVIGLAITVHGHLESIAQKAVSDEAFLAKLAAKVRPTAIVTTKETWEVDIGFTEYVPNVDIAQMTNQFGYVITLHPVKSLVHAPIVSCIDGNLHVLEQKRGLKHDWVFTVVPNPKGEMYWAMEGGRETNAVFRFKIEILH